MRAADFRLIPLLLHAFELARVTVIPAMTVMRVSARRGEIKRPTRGAPRLDRSSLDTHEQIRCPSVPRSHRSFIRRTSRPLLVDQSPRSLLYHANELRYACYASTAPPPFPTSFLSKNRSISISLSKRDNPYTLQVVTAGQHPSLLVLMKNPTS